MKKFQLIGAVVLGLAVVSSVYVGTSKVLAGDVSASNIKGTVSKPNSFLNLTSQAPKLSDIQDKMLNSIDNFQSMQGSYHWLDKPSNIDSVVTFNVKEGAHPGSYTKMVHADGTMLEESSDGTSVLDVDHKENSFKKFKISQEKVTYDNENFKTRKVPRIMKSSDGQPVYAYRIDPAAASQANDVVFPQAYAFWLSALPNKMSGHEQYLNRDATVITGTFDANMGKKFAATTFTLWVDTQTGVLLKFTATDAKGAVQEAIEVTDLKVNQANINTSKFNTTPPSGAKDLSYKQE